jgi:hypothetical protein
VLTADRLVVVSEETGVKLAAQMLDQLGGWVPV